MDALHSLRGPALAFLIVHATLGGVALLAGAFALAMRKGRRATAAVTAFTAVNFPTDVYWGSLVWLFARGGRNHAGLLGARRIRQGRVALDIAKR